MIGLRVRSQLQTDKLKKKVAAASFRSLSHAGGAIRLTARRSIRRRKNPSPAGKPPHTQTGRLKRSIRYEATTDTVVVGPVNEIAGKLWNLHEFGGRRKPKRRRHRRLRRGQHGPIRIRTTGPQPTFHRVRLESDAQASRANQLIAEEEKRRRSLTLRYPKRPFMTPALAINRPRLPRFWSNTVK